MMADDEKNDFCRARVQIACCIAILFLLRSGTMGADFLSISWGILTIKVMHPVDIYMTPRFLSVYIECVGLEERTCIKVSRHSPVPPNVDRK